MNSDKLKGIVPAAPSMQGNSIISSQVLQYEQGIKKAQKISLKYVIQGYECYEVNKQNYKVGGGAFLLMNEGSDYAIQLTGHQVNEGLCIYIDSAFLQQGLYSLRDDENHLLDNPYEYRDIDVNIFEGLYNSRDAGINRVLKKLSCLVSEKGIIEQFTDEYYLEIAEQLVMCQQDIMKTIRKIKAKKPSVQKELYKRANEAKIFIDESLFNPVTVEAIAQVVQMSPFHFQRIFKEVYRISPYQYLINERLKKAHYLLQTEHYKVTDVALMMGFADIYSFSKAFKQKFAYSPRYVMAKKRNSS